MLHCCHCPQKERSNQNPLSTCVRMEGRSLSTSVRSHTHDLWAAKIASVSGHIVYMFKTQISSFFRKKINSIEVVNRKD